MHKEAILKTFEERLTKELSEPDKAFMSKLRGHLGHVLSKYGYEGEEPGEIRADSKEVLQEKYAEYMNGALGGKMTLTVWTPKPHHVALSDNAIELAIKVFNGIDFAVPGASASASAASATAPDTKSAADKKNKPFK